jgi:hypothetical protein
VKSKTEQEGKFMVLREDMDAEAGGEAGKEDQEGGMTIGGDVSFYEWDYESQMPQKNQEE